MQNDEELTIKLTRYEVCELMLACTALKGNANKWEDLHGKLKRMIDEFDEKYKA